MAIFVYDDRRDFSRSHRIDHVLCRIIIPQHDVNTLTAQLARDSLHTSTTHANASAYRIDTAVVAFHRNLSARTWVSSSTTNFDHLFANFWHCNTKQLDQKVWVGTTDKQLCTARFRPHVIQRPAYPVTGTNRLTRQHFITENHGFSVVA